MAVPNRKLPANDVLIELYESGKSSGEIAEMFNCASVTVSQSLNRAGCRMRTAKEAAKLRRESGRWTPVEPGSGYWLGKTQPEEMVEKRAAAIRGENHYLWKGGTSLRPYRDVVEKKVCSRCGTAEKLAIHHVNFDYYDNRLENLRVFCLSCHSSIHKQAYWDSIHAGNVPVLSNGPSHWR